MPASSEPSSEVDIQPSAKALGKRRAITPLTAAPANSHQGSPHIPSALGTESDSDSDVELILVTKDHKSKEAKKENLTPFYTITCPICLGQPQDMVVTRCGHAFCGACLFGALTTPDHKESLMAQLNVGAAATPRARTAAAGGLPTGPCPVCRTKLDGNWGKAARGIMWKTKKRRKATFAGSKTADEPSFERKRKEDSEVEVVITKKLKLNNHLELEPPSSDTELAISGFKGREHEERRPAVEESPAELIRRDSRGNIVESQTTGSLD